MLSFPVNNLFCWRAVNGKQLLIFLIVVRGTNRWNLCWITLCLAHGGDEPASGAAIDMGSIHLAQSTIRRASCHAEHLFSFTCEEKLFKSSAVCPCSKTWPLALDYLIWDPATRTHTHTFRLLFLTVFFLPADQREDVQKKSFTKWVNSQLSKVRNILLFTIASVHWLYSRLWLYCTLWSHCLSVIIIMATCFCWLKWIIFLPMHNLVPFKWFYPHLEGRSSGDSQ